MNAPMNNVIKFETREAASAYVANTIAEISQYAVAHRGKASIGLSGGSTPRAAFESLAKKGLRWNKIHIGLIDDRWIPQSEPGSNANMIRETLLQGAASAAHFSGLVPKDADAENLTKMFMAQNTPVSAGNVQGQDLCLMGMGTDGHTASWFPGSKGLDDALDIDTQNALAFIDAAQCPGAGEYAHRITQTLPAILSARHVLLFITGEEKAKVFSGAAKKSVTEAPVKALLAAGPRLTTVWAP